MLYSIFAYIYFLVSSVVALSIDSQSPNAARLDPRDEWQSSALVCVFLTTDNDWHGESINLCQTAGRCSSKLPDGLSGKVVSAGPDEDATCFLYSEEHCQGDRSAPLVSPGYDDLSTIDFSNQAKSWRCWKHCGA